MTMAAVISSTTVLLFCLLVPVVSCAGDDNNRVAVCTVTPDPNASQSVQGVVTFFQATINSDLNINVELEGFDPVDDPASDAALHGFHVHTYGNITGGCAAAGGHFNPHGVDHGGPNDAVRHPGDFGNLRQTADGRISTNFTDKVASLYGDDSLHGRSIVVHAGKDDLGRGNNTASKANGNAGPRLGCCVIGVGKGPN